jgi:hypothetical protein
MNPTPLFWAIGIGILLLILMPRIHRLIVVAVANQIKVAETNRDSQEARTELQEVRQQLATIEGTSRDLARQRSRFKEKIEGCQREIAAPRRERIDLVFELGTPRFDDGQSLFTAVRIPATASGTPGNGRAPDPDVWRQPRLVRVWGTNANLAQSTAEQRFGSKRDFQLIAIDERQRSRIQI